jgi:hypothetical protein
MGNSNGIVKEGVKVMVECKKCGQYFETTKGTVTIKGETPVQSFCKECQKTIIKNINL